MLNWKKRKVGEWCWLHDPHMKERRPVKVLEVIEKNGIDWLCEWVENNPDLQKYVKAIRATSSDIVRSGLCKAAVKFKEKEKFR